VKSVKDLAEFILITHSESSSSYNVSGSTEFFSYSVSESQHLDDEDIDKIIDTFDTKPTRSHSRIEQWSSLVFELFFYLNLEISCKIDFSAFMLLTAQVIMCFLWLRSVRWRGFPKWDKYNF